MQQHTSVLRTLEWLRKNRSLVGNTMLMPLVNKQPMRPHKAPGAWTEELLDAYMRTTSNHPEWGLLLDKVVAIDADDKEAVEWLEAFPDVDTRSVMDTCPVQQTKKGLHYLFLRPSWATDEGFFDGARQVNGLNIDVKTVCSTGTRGVLVIEPSANKQWLKGRAPWDESVQLQEIPRALLEAVAKRRPVPAARTSGGTKSTSEAVAPAPSATDVVAPSPQLPSLVTKGNVLGNVEEEARTLVNMLSAYRADTYRCWMEVGWCLHNTSAGLLPLWEEFSRRSAKYKEGECAALWRSMRVGGGLTIRSLHYWAKRDDQAAYEAHFGGPLLALINTCTATHYDIASVAAKVLGESHVCASANARNWYYFNGNRWVEDPEGVLVRDALSSTVRARFTAAAARAAISGAVDASAVPDNDGDSTAPSTQSLRTDQMRAREEHRRLIDIATKLKSETFKDGVVRSLRGFLLDRDFVKRLDTNRDLVAFNNGVWELTRHLFREATPEDYVSFTTGYDFVEERSPELDVKIDAYWRTMHPNQDQREYLIKAFARQLYGDHGNELFHIHCGHLASASNGKSKFFEVLEGSFGMYVRKINVELLVAKQRPDPGRPAPEFAPWRGARILYCTEPNPNDKLNSGVLKELTGGEVIQYRMLHANEVQQFRPQFKIHLMANDAPQVDGADEGVRRRLRKVDYISRFVHPSEADPARHRYPRDEALIQEFRDSSLLKLAFARYLFDRFDIEYKYEMPESIIANSRLYLEENDAVARFVATYIERREGAFFTLKNAKQVFREQEGYFYSRIGLLKQDLQKALETPCWPQKWVNGANWTNVFMDYHLKSNFEVDVGGPAQAPPEIALD